MQRYMKHDKINFFQSPLPAPFCSHLHLAEPHHEWHDWHEDQLFQSPIKVPTSTQLFLGTAERVESDDSSLSSQQYREMTPIKQSQSVLPQINRKISFSEQEDDMLMALTPEKKARMDSEDNQNLSTIQRKRNYATPLSEMRFCERGLKKLASEAYLFVSGQKRTTYKQVAKRLIGQLTNDCEVQLQKKGEMNIKRRVYDALNVLIALGLLKRNGNKIVGRRSDDTVIVKQCYGETYEGTREGPSQQRQQLQASLRQREQAIAQKRKVLSAMQQKVKAVKQLQNRNKCHPAYKNMVQMPFVVVSTKSTEMEVEESALYIWKEEQSKLQMGFPSKAVQFSGDLDILPEIKFKKTSRGAKRG